MIYNNRIYKNSRSTLFFFLHFPRRCETKFDQKTREKESAQYEYEEEVKEEEEKEEENRRLLLSFSSVCDHTRTLLDH